MKILAIVLVILSLFIIIFPQFSDCESQGKQIELPNGKTISMKCHWSAIAEIAVGIPLLTLSLLLLFTRNKQTHLSLGIMGVVLGVLAILIPTYLIGVCSSDMMICNMLMRPALILAGGLVVIVSLAVTIVSALRKETPLTVA